MGFPHKWRELNPSHRYERITDTNMDEYVFNNFDSEIASVFIILEDSIMKADFLRYLIMLKEGGLWADIDVLPHQPISKWIPEEYRGKVNMVIGIENDHHKKPIWPGLPYSVQLCQYVMLAKPDHPAMKNVVRKVRDNLKEFESLQQPGEQIFFEDVMGETGPFIFTKIMMNYFEEKTGEEFNGDEFDSLEEPRLVGDVLVMSRESFGWIVADHPREKGNPTFLVEHLFIGSWRDNHPMETDLDA